MAQEHILYDAEALKYDWLCGLGDGQFSPLSHVCLRLFFFNFFKKNVGCTPQHLESLVSQPGTEPVSLHWNRVHNQLDGHESEQAPGAGDGQESLACCSPRDRQELAVTERLDGTEPLGRWGNPTHRPQKSGLCASIRPSL